MKLYLAGPMTGKRARNFPAFHKGAAKLRAAGYSVFSPAELSSNEVAAPSGTESKHLRKALLEDVTYICSEAEGIALLPGWEGSKGAAAEIALAKALGLPVHPIAIYLAIPQLSPLFWREFWN